MPIHTYRWRPDTCGCVITETHNTDTNEWSGIPESKCPAHTAVADAEHYDVVLKKENQIKNFMHGAMLDNEDLTDIIVGEKGIERRFKHGAEMKWEFQGTGKDRTLVVSLNSPIVDDNIQRLKDMKASKKAGENTAAIDALLSDETDKQNQLKAAMTKNAAALRSYAVSQWGPGKVIVNV